MHIAYLIATFILFLVCLIFCVRMFFGIPDGFSGVLKISGIVVIVIAILLSVTFLTYFIARV